jgi:hypothetical protein
VALASIGSFLRCEGETGPFGGNSFSGALRGTRFEDTDRYSFLGDPGRDEFKARIGGTRARGTFRDRRSVTGPGRTRTQCDTGLIRWRARSTPFA